jgi:hypothetical protein
VVRGGGVAAGVHGRRGGAAAVEEGGFACRSCCSGGRAWFAAGTEERHFDFVELVDVRRGLVWKFGFKSFDGDGRLGLSCR